MSCSRSSSSASASTAALSVALSPLEKGLARRVDGGEVEAPGALAPAARPALRRRTGSPRGARPFSSPRCLRCARPGTTPIDVYVNRSVAPGPARIEAAARGRPPGQRGAGQRRAQWPSRRCQRPPLLDPAVRLPAVAGPGVLVAAADPRVATAAPAPVAAEPDRAGEWRRAAAPRSTAPAARCR